MLKTAMLWRAAFWWSIPAGTGAESNGNSVMDAGDYLIGPKAEPNRNRFGVISGCLSAVFSRSSEVSTAKFLDEMPALSITAGRAKAIRPGVQRLPGFSK